MRERVGHSGGESGRSSLPPHAAAPPAAPGRTRGGDPILEAGARLGGYEITHVLGIGGMAVVYAAVQLSLRRRVAVKVPLARWAANSVFMQRFERESEALAALNHPNIVNIIDRGQAGQLPYFVMEYVDGVSLERAITAGSLSYGDYLAIIRQVRDALAYIHSNGIVHLDLKPANILLGRNGRVKVGDFGIAAMVWDSIAGGEAVGHSHLGTPRFMAPEQHQRAAVLDARTDIYALAVTYHLMFSGEFPEGGRPRTSLGDGGMPRAVDAVLEKALAPSPSQRYATVEQFSNDLLEALVGTSAFLQIDSLLVRPVSFGMEGGSESPTAASSPEGVFSGSPEPEPAGSDSTGTVTVDLAEGERIGAAAVGGPVEAVERVAGEAVSGSTGRRAPWLVVLPAALILTAAAGAFWWPRVVPPREGNEVPPVEHSDSAPPVRPFVPPVPWTLSGSLAVPRHSYSFLALSREGDLALATFNNRSLGALPQELPVIVVRNALGGIPEPREVCAHAFAPQRGYSGVAFGEDGALFVSADTGQGESSFLARYMPEGELDTRFGIGGRLMPGRRCHGIDAAGGKLYLALDNGEVLVLDPATGRHLGTLPKARGRGIVRDLAVEEATGRVFGIRTGGLVVWSRDGRRGDGWEAYMFEELTPSDSRPPRALEGICFNLAGGRALHVPDKTAYTVECDGLGSPVRFPIGDAPEGAVFVDGAVSPDGETLFLSDVALMQVHVLRRQRE